MDFDPVVGSEQGGRRPAVVLSPTIYNALSPVITVAAITIRKLERVYPFETLLDSAETGLSQPSKVMLNQVRTVSVRRVGGRLGRLDRAEIARMDVALAYAIGLSRLE
ncbi:MAG: type II toxin-antitoxin system PemK/MazF family toxin [Fimbriimonadaceae bacterium]|nr:type II toxin-antitoxin system PemK/MazF family toxin [Fimbriimonadaceae bacterium]